MQSKEVPIGCVIVDKRADLVLGRGRNRTNESKNATRHAEFEAIREVCEALGASRPPWSTLSLYVTVEPCIMCTAALRRIGKFFRP
jgi:tRNA-specific adenosine deaminase 2